MPLYRSSRTVAFVCLLIAFAATPTVRAQTPTERGRAFTEWLYRGDLEGLYDRFSPDMRRTVGGLDGLKAFQAKLVDQLGTESNVVRESVRTILGRSVYDRIASFSKTSKQVQAEWTWDDSGVIVGGFVQSLEAAAPSTHLDYQTRTRLQLPFNGAWFVVWGGRNPEDNYHVVSANQRFAYDFLLVQGAESHTGDGADNRNYLCFGRAVQAPAAGTIVEAVDSLPDNQPGFPSATSALGNHVVIDHGNGEFSVLGHMRQGSLAVKAGDQVKAGGPIGECGNSGASSEPHLHYHLQDGPQLGTSAGLPAQFLDYIADGQPVARGEPRRGEKVRRR